jgi:hypothetical protein
MSKAARNREIKALLTKAFAPHKVSVTGGRGTAYGWVDVHVHHSPRNRRETTELREKVVALIKAAGIELGTYYGDDDYAKSEIIVQFDACLETADSFGPEAWKQNLGAAEWDALQKTYVEVDKETAYGSTVRLSRSVRVF